MVNWFSTKVPRSVNGKIIVFVTTGTRTTDNPCSKKRKQAKKFNLHVLSYTNTPKYFKMQNFWKKTKEQIGGSRNWQTFSAKSKTVNITDFVGYPALLQIYNSVIVAWKQHRQWVNIRSWPYSIKTLRTKTSSGLNGL